METRTLTPLPEKTGERLDRYVCDILDVPRSQVQGWMERGLVEIGGHSCAKNYRLRQGDIVEVHIPEPVAYEAKAEDIPLDIVYEDGDLLVVNKPKGMVVHPAAGNYDGTLVNALLSHCAGKLSGINGVMRPGIVHRIDKDTSGLLIVAKNDLAHQGLAAQIKAHSFTRMYEAVVVGRLKDDNGTIDMPIGRHPVNRKKMAVFAPGSPEAERFAKNAVTHYKVIARYKGYTHIQVKLETGRTHQIRVHMAYLGHPVAGDPVYGDGKPTSLCGQCLHARVIGFRHPRDGRFIELSSPLPEYFTAFLKTLGAPE